MAEYVGRLSKGSNNKPASTYVGRFADKKITPKKTLGEKVTNTAVKINTFMGGKAVSDKIGGEIARAAAAPDEKKYITVPTNKQVAASAG